MISTKRPHSNLILKVLAAGALLVAFAAAASAQTAVRRARLGNHTEDTAYVTSGAYANQVAVVDGFEVFALPTLGNNQAEPVKMFDLPMTSTVAMPRGIAYVESEKLFVFDDPGRPGQLYLCDEAGRARGYRTIKFPAGYAPNHVEGLAYIPASSGFYPDHLVMVSLVFDEVGGTHSSLLVIRRDGQVVEQIAPPQLDGLFIGGVEYQSSPDRLLVGVDANLYTVSFSGQVVSGPKAVPGVAFIEGLSEARDGSMTVADGQPGRLMFLDRKTLDRTPERDRDYAIGVGIHGPVGVAWDAAAGQLLVRDIGTNVISSLAAALDSAAAYRDLTAAGLPLAARMTFMPDENSLAVVNRGQPASERRIVIFKPDNTTESINVFRSGFGNPQGATYIPSSKQFAVRYNGVPNKLQLFSRVGGGYAGEIDLSKAGVIFANDAAYFDTPQGGRLLVAANSDRMIVTDLNGNLLSEFNARTYLNVTAVSSVVAITTGPDAGSFALASSETNEVVVFRLN